MPSFEKNAVGVWQLDLLVVDEIDELVKGLSFLEIYGAAVAVIQSDEDLDWLLERVIWHFGLQKELLCYWWSLEMSQFSEKERIAKGEM